MSQDLINTIYKKDMMKDIDIDTLMYDLFMAAKAMASGQDPLQYIWEYIEVFEKAETYHDNEISDCNKKIEDMTVEEMTTCYTEKELVKIAKSLGFKAKVAHLEIHTAQKIYDYYH